MERKLRSLLLLLPYSLFISLGAFSVLQNVTSKYNTTEKLMVFTDPLGLILNLGPILIYVRDRMKYTGIEFQDGEDDLVW